MGQLLLPDITITMEYDPAALSGVPESSLKLAYYDNTLSNWVPLTHVVIDSVNHIISGMANHLTLFAVIADTMSQPTNSTAVPTTTVSTSPIITSVQTTPTQSGSGLGWPLIIGIIGGTFVVITIVTFLWERRRH
jgi:hypothetical protein